LIGASSARSAASAQSDSTAAGIAEQGRQYDTTRADYAPFRAAGTKALGQLQTENDRPFDSSQVQLDPGYQFGLQQGQQAIDRKAAASGGRVSGAALKAAAEYGTNYATTGYSTAYNRANQARTDRLNRLAALAGIGQTATGGTANAGANASNNISNMTTAQGNASGAATLAQGNIWGNGINQLGAIGQKWANTPAATPAPAASTLEWA
jgi:hypothetical protein